MDRTPMTQAGADKLKCELEELKKRRPLISKAIAEARALGDLKENAEYHAAKDEQGLAEARMRDIESKLSSAQIIDVTKMTNSGKVIFGATVALINVATDEAVRYQIVGDDESDIKAHKISVNSPIARALIGKEEGDTVQAQTPSGVIEYEIDQVEYV